MLHKCITMKCYKSNRLRYTWASLREDIKGKMFSCNCPIWQCLVCAFTVKGWVLTPKKRVNRDKTDFATKQSKSHKREILQQNSIKCDKTSKIVLIITDFPHISHVEKFLHVTEFHHIDHVEKFSS